MNISRTKEEILMPLRMVNFENWVMFADLKEQGAALALPHGLCVWKTKEKEC